MIGFYLVVRQRFIRSVIRSRATRPFGQVTTDRIVDIVSGSHMSPVCCLNPADDNMTCEQQPSLSLLFSVLMSCCCFRVLFARDGTGLVFVFSFLFFFIMRIYLWVDFIISLRWILLFGFIVNISFNWQQDRK